MKIRKINDDRQLSDEDSHQSDKPTPVKHATDPTTDSDSYDESDPVMGAAPQGRKESKGERNPKGVITREKGSAAETGKSSGKPKSGANIAGKTGMMHGSKEKAQHFANALKQAHNTWGAPGQNVNFGSEGENPHNAANPAGREVEATVIGSVGEGGPGPIHTGGSNPLNRKGPLGRSSGAAHRHAITGKSLSPSTKEGKRPAVKYAAAGGND